MIKSLEVSIAVVMLIFFMLTITTLYTPKENKELSLDRTLYSLVSQKAKDNEFREDIENNNLEDINNSLYNEIDVEYTISLCNFINQNCSLLGNIKSSTTNTVEYYFYDSNKSLNVIYWVS